MIKRLGALNIFFSNPTLKKILKVEFHMCGTLIFLDSLKRGIQMEFFSSFSS